jgi:hypothetical protein
MFSRKPQLGFNGCSALGLHRVADLPARACFLEALEAREFLPLLSIGKLNYPGATEILPACIFQQLDVQKGLRDNGDG